VVHPCRAGDDGTVQRAFDGQSRKRDVAGRLACAFGLATDTILAIDYRRLARSEPQLKPDVFGNRRELLRAGGFVPLRFPVAVPDAALFEADAGNARSGAV
jgi:hypothetical protein